MTGTAIITRAMRAILATASGETPSSDELSDAQSILNSMLAGWGADRLAIFTITRAVFSLTAGKGTYTCGPGGDFNMNPRPPKIERWSPVNPNGTYPVELRDDSYGGAPLTDAEWREVRVKTVPSPIPRAMYDDGGFPLRNLSFWPQPSDSSYQVALYSWTALSQFTDLTTDFTFPPGYEEAIAYNLAKRLAAEGFGTLSPDARELAMSSLARIKSMNSPVVKLQCEPVFSPDAGTYNWLTDNQ